jgi:hypothetical protein
MSVAHGTPPDLPGYGARTFTLMPVGSTSSRPCKYRASIFSATSPHDAASIRFLFVRPALCLQLPSDSQSPATPLPSANTSPCRVCRGLPPPSTCALPGAPKKAPRERGAFCQRSRRYQRLIASPLTSTSTRRFGARQAISSFIAVIVHTTPGTGWVLPMPRVSILSLATPFDTR